MLLTEIGISEKERELKRLQSIDDLFKGFHKDRRLHELYPDNSRDRLKDLNKFESNYESFLSTVNKDYLNLLLENHGIKPFNEIESNDLFYLFEIEKRPKGRIERVTENFLPKKEGYLLKIDKSIGIFGFEENTTNRPNATHVIYNGEIINYGSIDFIRKKDFKIKKNGKMLDGDFERKEHMNILELPLGYDPKKVNIPSLDSSLCKANDIREYIKAIVYKKSSLLFIH